MFNNVKVPFVGPKLFLTKEKGQSDRPVENQTGIQIRQTNKHTERQRERRNRKICIIKKYYAL